MRALIPVTALFAVLSTATQSSEGIDGLDLTGQVEVLNVGNYSAELSSPMKL